MKKIVVSVLGVREYIPSISVSFAFLCVFFITSIEHPDVPWYMRVYIAMWGIVLLVLMAGRESRGMMPKMIVQDGQKKGIE